MDYNSEDSYDDILLEPVILINEEDDIPLNEEDEIDGKSNPDSVRSLGPDISIIPIKRKEPLFKIRLFDKKEGIKKTISSPKEVGTSAKKSPRNDVRIITKEEADQSWRTRKRRESLPLEKCPICNKYFKRMATHLSKHKGVPPTTQNSSLVCEFCNKSFNTLSNLLTHHRSHTGSKPYQCEICSKGFSQSCNLVNHMRIHSGERPYKCPYCDRAFTQSGNLNNHIRLHTNEKPFKCHLCDKAFVQSGNLNSHIKNNHRYIEKEVAENQEQSLSKLNHTV